MSQKDINFMKPIYFLFLLIIIAGCQQQVPETVYDLDAQSIIGQTRQMRASTLYESPEDRIQELPVKIFQGHILDMEYATSEERQNQKILIIKVQKENKELLLKIPESEATQIVLNMNVTIHYQLKQQEVVVLEIEKNDE